MLIGFSVSLIFIALTVIKISKGTAKTIEAPDKLVYMQVVYTPNVAEGSADLIERISRFKDDKLEIRVVDKDVFDLHPVDKTFIISRDKDISIAELVADELGIDSDNIIFQPLDNNYQQIAVTLVLGDDYEHIMYDESEEI